VRSKQTSHIKQMKFVQVFFIEKDKWCLDGYEVNLKLFAVFSLIEKNSNYRVFLHFFYRNLKWKTKNIFKNWTIFFEKGQLIESQLRILMSSIYWNNSSSRKKKKKIDEILKKSQFDEFWNLKNHLGTQFFCDARYFLTH
jgi:hypothetical protein